MTAGHTRCLVDGCFALLKKKYCRSDTYTLQQLCEVVNSSAACNVAELVDPDKTPWYDWDTYLMQRFKPLKGVSKLSHFVFDHQTPGVVKVSSSLAGDQELVHLLKPEVQPATLSSLVLLAILPPRGLTADRVQYLHKHIREHVAPAFQGELCPEPKPIE